MPYRISRLGIVEIRSLDLDRDLDYYLNVLGLQLTAREGKTAYLKGWDERHAYSVALTEAERAGMVRLAFRTVDPEDLDYYEHRLRQFSVAYDVNASSNCQMWRTAAMLPFVSKTTSALASTKTWGCAPAGAEAASASTQTDAATARRWANLIKLEIP